MKSYYYRSKSLANSFLFILPLLVLYEVGIAMQGSGIKNTADVVIKTPLIVFGRNGSLIFNLLVIAFLFVSVFYIEKEYRFSSLIFIPMLMEGAAYALFMGYVLGFLVYEVLFPLALAKPFSTNMWQGIVLSVGAGVYEEIVFRLLFNHGALFYTYKAIKNKETPKCNCKCLDRRINIRLRALYRTFKRYFYLCQFYVQIVSRASSISYLHVSGIRRCCLYTRHI